MESEADEDFELDEMASVIKSKGAKLVGDTSTTKKKRQAKNEFDDDDDSNDDDSDDDDSNDIAGKKDKEDVTLNKQKPKSTKVVGKQSISTDPDSINEWDVDGAMLTAGKLDPNFNFFLLFIFCLRTPVHSGMNLTIRSVMKKKYCR